MTREYEILDSREAGGRAIRGGMVRTAAFAGGLLLGLASAPLVIRHLGDADFGRYASVLAVVSIVTGLTEAGINTVATRELAAASDRGTRDRAMADLLGLRLVLSAIGVLVAVGFSAVAGYGADLVLGTLLASIGMVFTVSQSLLGAVLQAQLRFGVAAAIDLLRGLLTTILMVACVVADAGVVAFLAVAIPAAAAAWLANVIVVRSSTALRPAFHPGRWLPLLRETAVFAVAVAVNSLYFRVTLVLMSVIATAEQTGHFAVSFRVMEVLSSVPVILVGAAFPIISRSARSDRARFTSATGRLFELSLITGALLSLALTLSAPFIVEVLTGSSEDPATDVLRIQALAIMASFVASATGYPLLSLHRNREVLAANVASLIVVTVLALALVPGLGAQGGAVAAVVADFTLCLANIAFLLRAGPASVPLAAAPVALIAGGVGYAAGRLVGIHPVVETAVGCAAFVGVLLACGRFPPEARELVRRGGRQQWGGA